MTTPRPTRRRNNTPEPQPFNLRNDEGSLLLVILFTLIMTALILVITASALSALQKTRNSRDYAIALQAADAAFADATITANISPTTFTNLTVCTTTPITSCPTTSRKTSTLNSIGNVTWQWTATRVADRAWTLTVEAQGKALDRNFSSTLKGTQVVSGVLNTSANTLRYIVAGTQNYEFGFYGDTAFNVANTSPASQPVIDGYNGEDGTAGSSGVLTLRSAALDQIDEWAWTSDTGRCVGTYCPTTGAEPAKVNRIRTNPSFPDSITSNCAVSYGAWKTSTNGTNPLIANRCYDSLTFDSNAPLPPINGIIYVKTGGVTVNAGVTVGTTGSASNASSSRLRIATLGNFVQNAKSKIAMAVYAPNGTCNVNADVPVATTPTNQTLWLGAATCKTFNITGSARLRYDGGLALVNDDPNTANTGKWIWSVYDYQSLN